MKLHPDPVIAGILEQVRLGDAGVVGMLADFLEDHDLPHRRAVRQLASNFDTFERLQADPDYKPRKTFSRWEERALWLRFIRNRIRTLYKMPWPRRVPYEYFSRTATEARIKRARKREEKKRREQKKRRSEDVSMLAELGSIPPEATRWLF